MTALTDGSVEMRFAVGLGCNLGDRVAHLRHGLRCVAAHARHLEVSTVYETRPQHYEAQPDFLNACCVGRTLLTPRQLLSVLQDAETAAGRMRGGERYGPRELDLDLLLYGDLMVEDEALTVPHPGLHERAFVLVPLAELAPEWIVPGGPPAGGRTIADLAREIGRAGIRRTDESL